MSIRKPAGKARVIKRVLLLPLAIATSAAWAQTVTYGVPTSTSATTIPVLVTTTTTLTGCQPPGVNGTTKTTQPGTAQILPPWQVENASIDAAGSALYGPTDTLPSRLQPAAVLVVTDGVSQSAGQSFTGPTDTAVTTAGRIDASTVTYNYGASVTGTKFTETFKASQIYESDTIPIDQVGLQTTYNTSSVYDVTTAKQVLSIDQTTTYSDPSYTGELPNNCSSSTTQVSTGTDTLTYNTAPAIQVATLLPPATVGAAYSAPLVTGGKPAGGPYTLSVQNLPPGLKLNPDGTVTGSPTAPLSGSQTFSLVVNASDGTEINPPAPSQLTVTAPGGSSAACLPPVPAALPAGQSWYQLDPAWASLPYDNLQSTHSETGAHTTIGDRGGLLTALAYMLSSAGVPYTPATLDTVIGQHAADFSWAVAGRPDDGGAISIGTAVLDASVGYPAATSSGVEFNRENLGSMLTKDLDTYLCTTMVPVLLQVNDPSSNYRHYVVATEKNGDGYHIMDPGFKARTNLSAYGGKFRIIGVLGARYPFPLTPPAVPTQTELSFNIVDGATLAVYDPHTGETGVIGSTANAPAKGAPDAAYLAIDNASDTDAGSIAPTSTTYSVQLITDVYTTGTQPIYTVRVSGLHTGIYYLTIKAVGALNVVTSVPGIAANGTTANYLLRLDGAGKTMHMWPLGSWSAALQDVTNAKSLGVLGTADVATLTGYLNSAQAAAKFTDATHKAQFTAALNAFIAKVKTYHSPDVVNVLNGDGLSLLAGPDYP